MDPTRDRASPPPPAAPPAAPTIWTPIPPQRAQADGAACFANLAVLLRHLGRMPRREDCDLPPSTVAASAYVARCGSWARARDAFAVFMAECPPPPLPPPTTTPTTTPMPPSVPARAPRKQAGVAARGPRAVTQSLRYQTMRRDRFRCTRCARSPATDLRCKLAVRLTVPHEQGGEPVPENLRTLCERCDAGHGA